MKKALTVLLSLAILLTFSMGALADSQTESQTPRLDSQIQKLQQLKQLQSELQPLKAEISIIRNLHNQTVSLREQIRTQDENQLRPLLQQSRQAKNWDGIIQALVDLKQVKADLSSIKALDQQNSTLWSQMRGYRQNKDYSGALNALQQIENNVRAKLDTYHKAQTDWSKTISDLQAALAKQPAAVQPQASTTPQ